jgi:hypothetical protein
MTFIKQDEPTKRKTKPQPIEPPKPAKIRLEGTAAYGRYYWCAKTESSEDGEIYVYADEVRYSPSGGVLFVRLRDDGTEQINLALSSGNWSAVFAASCWDGHAVAVEHWKGEVVR